MFTIHAMVGKRQNQINMPRLYAYNLLIKGALEIQGGDFWMRFLGMCHQPI